MTLVPNIKCSSGRRPGVMLVGLALLLGRPGAAAPQEVTSPGLREATIRRLKSQPVGNHTLEIMRLPEPFLGRVADRVIQMSFQNVHRRVAAPSDSAISRTSSANRADGRTESTTPKPSGAAGGVAGWLAFAGAVLALALTVLVTWRRRFSRGVAGNPP